MKTCSDSLKELFRQYRAGERRTWYIADLYTIWLNSSEKIDGLLAWRPYQDGAINYTTGEFDLGLYATKYWEGDAIFDDPRTARVRAAGPSSEVLDWDKDDWTIEFFMQSRWGILDGNAYPFAITTATTFPAYIGDTTSVRGIFMRWVNGFLYMLFWIKNTINQTTFQVSIVAGVVNSYDRNFWHIALVKSGRTLSSTLDGVVQSSRTLRENEELFVPISSYINLACADYKYVIDEFRISSCARYTSDFSVPSAPFTPDGNTLSLLHLNGNLDDEGYMSDTSKGQKDFRSGEIHLFTGHDTDLTCGGNKYRHITIQHGDIEESRGTETATMDLTINYNPNDTIEPNDTRTWFRALKDGVFDNAFISLDRLYSPIPWQYNMPDISTDYVLKSRFFGRMDVQSVKIDSASIQVKSPTDMLSRELPRNLVKPSCLNHFGDFMCQMNPENYTAEVTALSGSTRTHIRISGGYYSGLLDNGTIYCISGKNKGQRSSIRNHYFGTVVVYKPFAEEISVGDKFIVGLGCDKTMKMCRDTYGNLVHFRGFPYLPCKNVLI